MYATRSGYLEGYYQHPPPPPQDYSYIVAGAHCRGLQALTYFLQKLNLSPILWYILRNDEPSFELWKFRLLHRCKLTNFRWGIVLDGSYRNPRTVKMLASLKKEVPVICLVRDPISVIKTYINMPRTEDMEGLIIGRCESVPKVPAIDLLNGVIALSIRYFEFTTSLRQIQHVTKEIIFIETTDISGHDNTIKTLQRISKILQIEDIQYEDFCSGDVTFNDFIKRSFPRAETIGITSECFRIVFGFEESFYRESYDGLKPALPYPILFENIPSSSFPNKSFKVLLGKRFVLERTLKKLREDPSVKTAVSSAIEQYCAKVLEAERRHKEAMLDERGVLKLLKENPESSKKLRELLKYEVSEIERLAPHIVEKWQYYKMFLEDES